MTQPEDARRLRVATERITGTYYCHSGAHQVSNAIASTIHRGRRTCANCKARIRKLKPRSNP